MSRVRDREPAAGKRTKQKSGDGGERRSEGEPGRTRRGEAEKHDVTGHIRDEDAIEFQITHGIDETRHHR
jgi:hypothetical protein